MSFSVRFDIVINADVKKMALDKCGGVFIFFFQGTQAVSEER